MILKQLIELECLPIIYRRCYPIKKETIYSIFYGNKEYQKTKNAYAKNSFEGILNLEMVNRDLEVDILCGSFDIDLKYLCAKYLSSKKTIVKVTSELVHLLENKLGKKMNYVVPEFNYENAIERQLFLIKFLHHDEQHTFEQACAYLWMYNRERILEDVQDINKGLSFLGKGIKLEIDKNNNEITSFPTGHPILMVENLSQIFVQLEGLRRMAHGSTKTYAYATAATIWSQLSDYAQNRIMFVIENLYESDPEFYRKLELMDTNQIFYTEDALSQKHGSTSILNYLKNDYDFYIAYKGETNKTLIKHCRMNKKQRVTFDTFYLVEIDTNEEFTVSEAKIISCSRNKEDLGILAL